MTCLPDQYTTLCLIFIAYKIKEIIIVFFVIPINLSLCMTDVIDGDLAVQSSERLFYYAGSKDYATHLSKVILMDRPGSDSITHSQLRESL